MLAGCSDQSLKPDNRPVIAASIYPVASLVDQLTHGWANVVTLLPQGAEEHDFEMTANQVRELNKADLLVLVGSGLDTWAEPKAGMAAAGKGLKVLRISELIQNVGAETAAAAPAAAHDSATPPTGNASAAVAPIAKTSSESADAANATTGLGPPPTPTPDKLGTNNHLWLDPVIALRFVKAISGQLADRYPEHRRTEIEQAAADADGFDWRNRPGLSS